VLPANEREGLRRAADQLCAELGYSGAGEAPPRANSLLAEGDAESILGSLSPEDESLVAAIRRSLAKLAAAVAAGSPTGVPRSEVGALLDATELVMRAELARAHAKQLPDLLPSFVFLVTLPIVGQDEALELSQRAARLVESMRI
jgi:hypothetical protein